MTNTEFFKELKMLINSHRVKLLELKKESNSETLKESLKRSGEMLDKLEQDYFDNPIRNLDITKGFVVNADLITKSEISITEQVKEGLLKVFNDLLKAFDKYVEIRENNELKDYEFDYANFNISLCQIADRLLQIESDRKMTNSLGGKRKND